MLYSKPSPRPDKEGSSPATQLLMSSLVNVSMKVRIGELQHPGYPWPISKWRGGVERVKLSGVAGRGNCGRISQGATFQSCHPCQMACQSSVQVKNGLKLSKNPPAWLLSGTHSGRFTPQNALF